MGFSSRAVDAMSLWQFQAAADGYRKSIEGEQPEAPSEERFMGWLAGKH